MSEIISWSLNAGGPSASGIDAAGSVSGDATVAVKVALEAGSAARPLALQVDTMDSVRMLLISSSQLDGTVTVQATGPDPTALTGPILLFGAAAQLFANDLSVLTVHNTSAENDADLSVLIGLTV